MWSHEPKISLQSVVLVNSVSGCGFHSLFSLSNYLPRFFDHHSRRSVHGFLSVAVISPSPCSDQLPVNAPAHPLGHRRGYLSDESRIGFCMGDDASQDRAADLLCGDGFAHGSEFTDGFFGWQGLGCGDFRTGHHCGTSGVLWSLQMNSPSIATLSAR